MPVKFHCRKCGKRFVDWGAEKLGFKCPDCEDEELLRIGAPEDKPAKRPSLKRTETKRKVEGTKVVEALDREVEPEEVVADLDVEEEAEEPEEVDEAEKLPGGKPVAENEEGEEDALDFEQKDLSVSDEDEDEDKDVDVSEDLSFDEASSSLGTEAADEDSQW
ncbi:MAG TPA: hypothetical protein HPP77_07875 [Candidatus Hydrogenedentes bacterium]|nr:hypothetical protein [Candidatus Hydrogenedentota bacterium]HIJ72522.1 hypothetical protein [Candidatus Hydrogenedentota bacterium]